MKPASALPPVVARSLLGVLFDLDDTVLSEGRLTLDALAALYDLHASGLTLVGVTGRPAAWGQVLARQWPVAGMVTENGIIAVTREHHRIRLYDRLAPDQRQAQRARLLGLVAELMARFPELEPSDDIAGRFADYTFDIAESKIVALDIVQAASEFARARGARVVRSSIHLHVALDADDKASGVLRFLRAHSGVDATSACHRFAFVGDSENDAPCFAAFQHSFGVANLRGRPSLSPRYLASRAYGDGFAEIARIISESRRGR